MLQNFSFALVVIGALRVNGNFRLISIYTSLIFESLHDQESLDVQPWKTYLDITEKLLTWM